MTDLAINPGITKNTICPKCQWALLYATDLSPTPPDGPWYYLHSDIDCLRVCLMNALDNIRNEIRNEIRSLPH